MDALLTVILCALSILVGYARGRRDTEREYEDMVRRLEQTTVETEALYQAKVRMN